MKLLILIMAVTAAGTFVLACTFSLLAWVYFKYKRKALLDPVALFLEQQAVQFWKAFSILILSYAAILLTIKLFTNG